MVQDGECSVASHLPILLPPSVTGPSVSRPSLCTQWGKGASLPLSCTLESYTGKPQFPSAHTQLPAPPSAASVSPEGTP